MQWMRRSRIRALTLTEVMIAISMMSIAFLTVAFVQVATVKQTDTLNTDARTLHRAHIVMERVMKELCMAQLGSEDILDDGRTIEFFNPMKSATPGSPVSAIKFESGYAKYYHDKSQTNPTHQTGLVDNIQFERINTIPLSGRGIRVTITTISHKTWKLDRPYRLITEVALRN